MAYEKGDARLYMMKCIKDAQKYNPKLNMSEADQLAALDQTYEKYQDKKQIRTYIRLSIEFHLAQTLYKKLKKPLLQTVWKAWTQDLWKHTNDGQSRWHTLKDNLNCHTRSVAQVEQIVGNPDDTFLLNRLPVSILSKIYTAHAEKVVYLKSTCPDTTNQVIHKCVKYTKEHQQQQLLSFWAKRFGWDLSETPFTKATYEEKYPDATRRKKRGCIDYDIKREYDNIMQFAGMRDHTNKTSEIKGDDYLRYNVAVRFYLDEDGLLEDIQDKRMRKTLQIPYRKEIICVRPKGKKKRTFEKLYTKYEVCEYMDSLNYNITQGNKTK